MTRTVHLHVGSPKSGTTYLQQVLETNRQRLADAGVLVVGADQGTRVQAGLQVREDPRWRELPVHRQDMWGALVSEIKAWSGEQAILSYELLSAATRAQAEAALADLADFEVHVVVTSRDLGAALPSAWQERLKFGSTTPLEDWTPPQESRPRAEWGWRTMDPVGVLDRWGATLPPERCHVVTAPRAGGSSDTLWERFAQATGLSGIDVDSSIPRSNTSVDSVQAEFVRRLNEELGDALATSRERARWVRDLVVRDSLPAGSAAPLGLTDAQFEEAVTRSARVIDALASSQYQIHGDLEDLRATRGTGRLPSQATDTEVLQVALGVVKELVVNQAAATTRKEAARSTSAERPMARRVVDRLTRPWVARTEQNHDQRIAELEAQVTAGRELHQRVAVLTDLVGQLLVPAGGRDDAALEAAIKQYRKNSL